MVEEEPLQPIPTVMVFYCSLLMADGFCGCSAEQPGAELEVRVKVLTEPKDGSWGLHWGALFKAELLSPLCPRVGVGSDEAPSGFPRKGSLRQRGFIKGIGRTK